MRRLFLITVILMLATSITTTFAAGGKNQGIIGNGTTTTGTDSQGTASQPRTGR